jgi:hypothetical protein
MPVGVLVVLVSALKASNIPYTPLFYESSVINSGKSVQDEFEVPLFKFRMLDYLNRTKDNINFHVH